MLALVHSAYNKILQFVSQVVEPPKLLSHMHPLIPEEINSCLTQTAKNHQKLLLDTLLQFFTGFSYTFISKSSCNMAINHIILNVIESHFKWSLRMMTAFPLPYLCPCFLCPLCHGSASFCSQPVLASGHGWSGSLPKAVWRHHWIWKMPATDKPQHKPRISLCLKHQFNQNYFQ